MCRIYNTIGSLTYIQSELESNAIHDCNSIQDLMAYKTAYEEHIETVYRKHSEQLQAEQHQLEAEISTITQQIEQAKAEAQKKHAAQLEDYHAKIVALQTSYKAYYIIDFWVQIQLLWLNARVKKLKKQFESQPNSVSEALEVLLAAKTSRFRWITGDFEAAVKQSAQNEVQQLERKRQVINALTNYIYGAFGEQKVVQTLQALPDDYHLINDFNMTFTQPLYYSYEREYIKSVQIDYVLIGPPGIFLLETKNWSEKSLNNLSLRSPVAQIKRASFALYTVLNGKSASLFLKDHHWGSKKVVVKNLIVFTNAKPQEEFQFVKLLHVNNLVNYVTYFKPIYTAQEVNEMANYLNRINP